MSVELPPPPPPAERRRPRPKSQPELPVSSGRRAKREAEAKKGMLQRTCRNCGHMWVVPKKLKGAPRMGALGGLLAGERTAGMVAATSAIRLDTCPKCGSVRSSTSVCSSRAGDTVTDDAQLLVSLRGFTPTARDALRRILIAGQWYRDAVAERLLREGGEGMADLLDLLTLNPEARRQVARLLGEIEASG